MSFNNCLHDRQPTMKHLKDESVTNCLQVKKQRENTRGIVCPLINSHNKQSSMKQLKDESFTKSLQLNKQREDTKIIVCPLLIVHKIGSTTIKHLNDDSVTFTYFHNIHYQ